MPPNLGPASPAFSPRNWLTRQNVLALLLVAMTGLAFYFCFLIMQPFLAPLAWALALAIIAHPLHDWLKTRGLNGSLAAALTVLAVVFILLVPAIFVTQQLLQEVVGIGDWMQSPEEQQRWRQALENSPLGGWYLWLERFFDLSAQVQTVASALLGSVSDFVRNSIGTVFQLLVVVFTLFYLFRDRNEVVQTLRSLVPLSQSETDEVLRLVRDTIHATIYGSVMMAMLQGALGGLMFWLLGLPSPVLWGVVMALLATVPNSGAFFIWVPAAIGLAVREEWTKSIILLVWGLCVVSTIDNILYPIVVGTRLRMHSLPIFFAVLGGMWFFGPAGIVLGPVVFALTHALIDIWRRRTRDGRAAENGVAPLVTKSVKVRETAAVVNPEATVIFEQSPR